MRLENDYGCVIEDKNMTDEEAKKYVKVGWRIIK